MMTVYGDDEHEIDDEETAPLPTGEPDMTGVDVLHFYLGGPLEPGAEDPS